MVFEFHPELFECRGRAMAALAARGFEWLSHYNSVDPLHDEYGLEVCGIPHERDAHAILLVLQRVFPRWPYHRIYYKDFGREVGWKAILARQFPRDKRETWTEG